MEPVIFIGSYLLLYLLPWLPLFKQIAKNKNKRTIFRFGFGITLLLNIGIIFLWFSKPPVSGQYSGYANFFDLLQTLGITLIISYFGLLMTWVFSKSVSQ
jgi:hypothetical protein